MTEDEKNCADMLRIQDPERFLSAMTAEGETRAALMVIYAFNLEIARAPWASQEEMLAEMRLQWWLDQVADIYEKGKVAPHMVMTPMLELVQKHDLPRAILDAMITALRWEIYHEPHADRAAFDGFINDTAGGVLRLAVQVSGAPLPDLDALALHGYARGIAAWFRAVPALEQFGRAAPLLDRSNDGVRNLAREALKLDGKAKKILKKTDKCLLPALRGGWMAPAILRKAIDNPDLVLHGGLEAAEGVSRLALMWKTATRQF